MKKRLDKLCSLVDGNIVADIGCDHGYLCEMLVEKGVKEIYACEVTQKNLEKAKNNIVNYVNRKCIKGGVNNAALCCGKLCGSCGSPENTGFGERG